MPSVGVDDERLVHLSNGYADTFQFFVESCEVIYLKKVKYQNLPLCSWIAAQQREDKSDGIYMDFRNKISVTAFGVCVVRSTFIP